MGLGPPNIWVSGIILLKKNCPICLIIIENVFFFFLSHSIFIVKCVFVFVKVLDHSCF